MAALAAARKGPAGGGGRGAAVTGGGAPGRSTNPSNPSLADFEIPDDVELPENLEQLNEQQLAELQAKLLTTKHGHTLTPFGEFVEVFAELICAAQEFVRTLHGGERSVVSLRDVARCVKVYRWFGEHFASRNEGAFTLDEFFSVKKKAEPFVRQAVFLSLAYCYHARLPRGMLHFYLSRRSLRSLTFGNRFAGCCCVQSNAVSSASTFRTHGRRCSAPSKRRTKSTAFGASL